jgi:integrase
MWAQHREVPRQEGGLPMNGQKTFEDMLNGYLEYRRVSKFKERSTSSLKTFFNACRRNYPENPYLTQKMVDVWNKKRDTERPASHMARIGPIAAFLHYALKKEWIDLVAPEIKKTSAGPYIPHAFTDGELYNFFNACEELEVNMLSYKSSKLRKLEVPVFFRLLYSTGMRPVEARLLRCENVDLSSGVIDIIYTKGYNEHRLVLHDTMLDLLMQYDRAVSRVIPSRRIFFPTVNDKCHHKSWVSRQFNEAWSEYNKANARAGDFRHFYAFSNINNWVNTGHEVHDKLLALSRSMGHTSMRHTMYYFSISETFGDIIEKYNGKSFNNVIPNLPDE